MDTILNAYKFIEAPSSVKAVWWNKTQNNTLQEFNSPLQTVVYELEAPADGNYDVVLSISTLSNEVSDKVLVVGDVMGKFHVPATSTYSDLQGLRINTNLPLKAGKNQIKIINIDNGRTILDWVGLIKSEK